MAGERRLQVRLCCSGLPQQLYKMSILFCYTIFIGDALYIYRYCFGCCKTMLTVVSGAEEVYTDRWWTVNCLGC